MDQRPMGNPLSTQPRAVGDAPNEIDLVELGVAMARRWKLILGVFVACTVLGLLGALVKQHSYRYTASIQLASYSVPDKVVQLLSPKSAGVLLQNGVIDAAVSQYSRAHGIDPRRLKLDVKVPNEGGVVVLSGEGPLELQEAFESVEQDAAALLARSTADHINAYRASIQASLDHAKIDLANLQDPERIAAARSELKQKWLAAEARLANLGQEHTVLAQKRVNLAHSLKLYEALAKELNAYLAKARNTGLSTTPAATPTQAMTALLLANQIQQNQRQWADIENQLTVTLPQQIAEAEASLADNERQQITQRAAVEQADIEYKNFEVQRQRSVHAQQVTVSKLQAQLDNIQSTRLVTPPVRSNTPVGISRTIIVVLAAFVGIVLGLLAAGVAGYLGAVRRAMAAASGVPTEHSPPRASEAARVG